MDYLFEKFKERVSPLLEPIGFKLKNRRFYIRITEERIYQSIELTRRPHTSMKYMALPLFLGKGIYLSSGGNWMGKAWYNFEKNEATHDENAAEMALFVKDVLIPFFEKTKTMSGAYQAEIEGSSMTRNYIIGLYHVRNGERQTILDEIDRVIALDEEGAKRNIACYRELNYMSEDKIQDYIKRVQKKREDGLQRKIFFAESSIENILKYFKANEEEVIRLAKWKFE